MSVPKGKRNVSRMEFFHLAHKLHREITLLMVRDFGVKSISRDLKSFTHSAKMNEEDRIAFTELCNKYHIDVEAEWPLWLIDSYRNWIVQLLRALVNNITTANTIYPAAPDYDMWFNLKKKYQKLAQANCNQLLQAMQSISYTLPVNHEKFMPYVEMLQNEMTAIKNWQKNTNKQRNSYYKQLQKEMQ